VYFCGPVKQKMLNLCIVVKPRNFENVTVYVTLFGPVPADKRSADSLLADIQDGANVQYFRPTENVIINPESVGAKKIPGGGPG